MTKENKRWLEVCFAAALIGAFIGHSSAVHIHTSVQTASLLQRSHENVGDLVTAMKHMAGKRADEAEAPSEE